MKQDFVTCGNSWVIDSPAAKRQRDESELQDALHLIKIHITESGQQSADLHQAVQHIVNVARRHGMLLR